MVVGKIVRAKEHRGACPGTLSKGATPEFGMEVPCLLPFEVMNRLYTELQCGICLGLLSVPVTTSCGHNFCTACMDSTLVGSSTADCRTCKHRFRAPKRGFAVNQPLGAVCALLFGGAVAAKATSLSIPIKAEKLAKVSPKPSTAKVSPKPRTASGVTQVTPVREPYKGQPLLARRVGSDDAWKWYANADAVASAIGMQNTTRVILAAIGKVECVGGGKGGNTKINRGWEVRYAPEGPPPKRELPKPQKREREQTEQTNTAANKLDRELLERSKKRPKIAAVAASVSSNYRGVAWLKSRGKWQAQATVGGKQMFLGLFTSEIAAAKSYDTAVRAAGASDRANFPDTPQQSRAAQNNENKAAAANTVSLLSVDSVRIGRDSVHVFSVVLAATKLVCSVSQSTNSVKLCVIILVYL